MGTVHGVWLKYVALSGLSFVGYSYYSDRNDDDNDTAAPLVSLLGLNVTRSTIPALIWGYSTAVNGVIAILFKLEWGMSILGKNTDKGTIPWWSYVVWFPFHIPTYLYTNLHTYLVLHKSPDKGTYERVPVATNVQPGWWIGGCHGHLLNKEWTAVIDLTVEFPESCRTAAYLAIPTWDGVPASPAQLEHAAAWAVQQHEQHGGGDILVHCAHGRGRSTTVLCACLVKAGLFDTWEQAFEEGIKPKRPVCKLNKRMRENLAQWQELYVAKGK